MPQRMHVCEAHALCAETLDTHMTFTCMRGYAVDCTLTTHGGKRNKIGEAAWS